MGAQGTAADVIKAAMVRVQELLERQGQFLTLPNRLVGEGIG